MEKMEDFKKSNVKRVTPVGILFLGFLALILVGSGLLVLPFASKSGESIKYIDALFVSTSATCVTGLTPFNTFQTFTLFGQIIILLLIQIGGLGFMTLISILLLWIKKELGVYSKTILVQSAGSFSFGSVKHLLRKIVIYTAIFEFVGWITLSLLMLPDFGGEAFYYGLFTAISAFCNAGFDLFSDSLVTYSSNAGIMITIMILINVGGLGFIVLSDLFDCKFRFSKLQVHSKIVLIGDLILILVPSLLFFLFEFVDVGQNGTYMDLSIGEKILNSLFLSITPRTAGFYTLDYSKLTAASKELTSILMFIGGNSGSTAGGLKVTTIVVVIIAVISTARRNEDTIIFKRKISNKVIQQSNALFFAYLLLLLISITAISTAEAGITTEESVFECISALSTVGLSLGVTSSLSIFSKIVLIVLMYLGRVGAFGLFYLIFRKSNKHLIAYPEGRILVG